VNKQIRYEDHYKVELPITTYICYLGTLEELFVNSHIFQQRRGARQSKTILKLRPPTHWSGKKPIGFLGVKSVAALHIQ